MVQASVGIKCPECAKMPRGARAGVMRPHQIAKALLAGVLVAVAGIPVVYMIFQIGWFSFILSAAAGYGGGTLVYRAGGRNGGPISVAVSVAAVLIAFLPFLLPPLLIGDFPAMIAIPALLAALFAGLANRK
ncbi:hypothetical protein [Rubrobacter taiwanensis]|uniref:hypothetical protein n=1 Tax=Rubrobacter taiwanensis TaxID=185139 RepID=UPI001A9E7B65|nr:hypothetical protein [Rubrobacter taiwanensis]